MKSTLVVLMIALLLTVSACSDAPGPKSEDHDVAYCVDKDGKVVEEEKCEEGSRYYDAASFHWIFVEPIHTYRVGTVIPAENGRTVARANVPTYKASVKVPTGGYRIVPVPARVPGWGVKASTPPTRSVTPARPVTPVRPAAPARPVSPPRPVIVPRGK